MNAANRIVNKRGGPDLPECFLPVACGGESSGNANAADPHLCPPTMTPDPTTPPSLFGSTPRKNLMQHADSQPPVPVSHAPTIHAARVDGHEPPPSRLLSIMRQWKAEIFRGAAAADQASQYIFEWLNARGQAGRTEGGLTRADLLAVNADELEMFLDDLRDLREQAEYAVEAMEAVITAVDKNDHDYR